MHPIRRILAASDLSPAARNAVVRATALARHGGARLTLQHVVGSGALEHLRQLFASAPADLQARLLDEARSELQDLATELCAAHLAATDLRLSSGKVAEEIVAGADALDADLLVLGAHGASLVRDLMIGSTTERVLRKSRRSLLVVKQMPHETYRRVLLPVDFSPRSVEALRFAEAVAPQAEFLLLHAFEVPFEGKLRYAGVEESALTSLRIHAKRDATAKMNELVSAAGVDEARVRRLVLHGEATTQILAQEQEQDCDLIVIGKRGLGLLEELLLGSVTKHILAQSSADVLVIDRTLA